VSDGARLSELLAAYAATAERWHELRGDARAANPVFDDNARLARELRALPQGRAAIAGLLGHPASGVRVLAAAHCIDACRDEATAVLEALQAGDGLHAIAAEHALAEFRAGRLELDGE
jgi:hypothetical protein